MAPKKEAEEGRPLGNGEAYFARRLYAWCTWTAKSFCLLPEPCLQALDRWENRLEALFEGRPYDALDAALTDTIARFPVHIQPFRDMIGGMRMDLVKSR